MPANWKERLGTAAVLAAGAMILDLALARFDVAPPPPGLAISRLAPLAWGLPLTLGLVYVLARRPKEEAKNSDAPGIGAALGEILSAVVLLALATGFANLARNSGRPGAPVLIRPGASLWLAALSSFGAVAAAAVRDRSWDEAARLHLPPSRALSHAAFGAATALALVPILALGIRFFPNAYPAEISRAAILAGAPEMNFLLAVLPALVLPLAEEALFRGRLLPALARRMPAAAAVGLQAVLFAGLHFDLDAFAPRLAAGVLLGLLRARTGDLWAGWTFHAFFNAGLLALPFLG